ncbi:hypothetical protein V2A60_007246 [Cordyceps javanica]
MDTTHGLEQLRVQEPARFSADIQARIMSYILPQYYITQSVTILIAGEARTDLNLIHMAQSLRHELLDRRFSKSSEEMFEHHNEHIEGDSDMEGKSDSDQLIIAENGVFDAAIDVVRCLGILRRHRRGYNGESMH